MRDYKSIVVLILGVFLLLSQTSCDLFGPDESGPGGESGLIPLQVGNTWKYSYTAWDESGNVVGFLSDTLTLKIVADTVIRDEGQAFSASVSEWFSKNNGRPSDGSLGLQWLRKNQREGHYIRGAFGPADTFIEEYLRLRYPAEEGQTWQVPRVVYYSRKQQFIIEDSLVYTLVATDREFETPAGTFRCYVYHHRDETIGGKADTAEVYDYYAPEIGYVGLELKRAGEKRVVARSALYAYRVNGKGNLDTSDSQPNGGDVVARNRRTEKEAPAGHSRDRLWPRDRALGTYVPHGGFFYQPIRQ